MGFLRRSTHSAAGFSAGAGDTGWSKTPQITVLTVRVKDVASVVTLPAGTVIFGTYMVRDVISGVPTAGTVAINKTTPAPLVYQAAIAATAPHRVDLVAPEELAADSSFTITPTGLDGAVYAGFTVALPADHK